MQLGEWLKCINQTKENPFVGGDLKALEKLYVPYIINRCMAAHLDCILIVNEMNVRAGPSFGMSKRGHFEALLHSIDRGNRFAKMPKAEREDRVELIMRLNNCSYQKAREFATLLTDQQFEELEAMTYEGGTKK